MTTPTATAPEFPIVAVTAFRDGARVIRAGSLPAPAGTGTVTIGTLPTSADPASVRVTARSGSASLVEVEVRRSHRVESFVDEVRRLQAEVDERRVCMQAIEDDDSAESARLAFLSNLSEAAATSLSRAVSFGRLDRAELSRMGDQLATDTASALARRRDIDARRREAKRELEALEARLADAGRRTDRSVEYFEVRASLEATGDTQVDFELAYHVAGASWRPLYDIRIEGDRLKLSYLAEVTQQTGEDWPEAQLSLSTTRRGRHRTIPELRPWSIGLAPKLQLRPVAAAARATMAAGPAAGAAAPDALLASRPAPGAAVAQAPPMMAEVEEAGAALNYQVPRPVAVPSDGAPHKVAVTEMELDADLDYVAVPVLALEAYLRATATNTSAVLLLPGSAHVFHDAEFVGVSELETVASGEGFELQMGVDERIRLERQLRRRTASKAMLGGTRTIDISYEITVENHRSQPSRISLHDHIPLSRDADVKVRLREVEPKPSEQDDLGELTWDLTLDPGKEVSVTYRFTVEHPGGSNVAGL